MKILSRLNLKKVQSAGSNDFSSCKPYVLYLSKDTGKLFYVSQYSTPYIVRFEKHYNVTGFFIYYEDNLESGDLWWVQNEDFEKVIKSTSEANSFNKKVISSIKGMKVQSNADKLRVYEKIDEVFNSFKKD